jgi:hypothetical protein
MMILFRSQKQNSIKTIVKNWAINTVLYCAFFLVAGLIFPQLAHSNSFWFFAMPFISFGLFISAAQNDYINEIIVDTKNARIIFRYYDINLGQTEKILDFANAGIKINERENSRDPITIHFFKGRCEIMNLSKPKDGFTLETLKELQVLLDSITSPIDKRQRFSAVA